MRREENDVTRRVMNMKEGQTGRGRPNKRWIECVRQGMREMAVSDEMTHWSAMVTLVSLIEENGRRGHAAPTPNELGKGQEEEDIVITIDLGLIDQQNVGKRSRDFLWILSMRKRDGSPFTGVSTIF
jgi:hypothetical protein